MNFSEQQLPVSETMAQTRKERQVKKRKTQDVSYIYTALGLIIVDALLLMISLYFIWKDDLVDKRKIMIAVLFLGLGFIVGMTLFPLYCLFLLKTKNYLIRLFYFLPPIMAAFLVFVGYALEITEKLAPVTIIVIIAYLYIRSKFKKQYKLAFVTSRNFLVLSENYKLVYLKALMKAVAIASGVLFFILISFVISTLYVAKRASKQNENDRLLVIAILGLFTLLCIYFVVKVLISVSYVYGAAAFDQYSLGLVPDSNLSSETSSRSILKPASSSYLEDAYEIAFRKSFGSACFAATSFGISKINKDLKEQNRDNPAMLSSNVPGTFDLKANYKGSISSSALLYSAMYGESLVECGKMALESFTANGLQSLLSVWLIGNLLDFISFVFVLVIGSAGTCLFLWIENCPADQIDDWHHLIIFYYWCVCGLVSLVCVNGYVSGGSNVQISIFVEDPERLEGKYRRLDTLKACMKKYHRKAQ